MLLEEVRCQAALKPHVGGAGLECREVRFEWARLAGGEAGPAKGCLTLTSSAGVLPSSKLAVEYEVPLMLKKPARHGCAGGQGHEVPGSTSAGQRAAEGVVANALLDKAKRETIVGLACSWQ